MDSEGAQLEHYIAEWFNVAGGCYIPAVEALFGSVFLFLLWRALYASPQTCKSQDGVA